MGRIGAFTPEKLIVPVLISREPLRPLLLAELTRRFGAIDFQSGEIPFSYTRYYDAEMGTPIKRFFLSFAPLVDPGELPRIKRQTNEIEDSLRIEGQRMANLDPGLLAFNHFILASSKPAPHRLPLADGVYAELTLLFERGTFKPLQWTYPDYRSGEYRAVLLEIRKLYRKQLHGRRSR